MRELVLLGLGFGCLVGYARMVSLGFVGYLSDDVFVSVDAWYGLRAVVGLLALALLALSGWFQWFKVGTKTLLVAAAAAVAAPIVFAVDEGGGLGAVVAVLGGAGAAVLMYAWMLLLSRFDMKEIVTAALGGLVVSGAIVTGVPYLDTALGMIVAVAAAFASGACALLLDSDLSSCAPDGRLSKEQAALVPWPLVVLVLACGFFSTVLYGIAAHLTWLYDWSPNYIAFGGAVVITVGATFAIMVRRPDWMRLAWVPLLALLALELAFSCFSLRESIQIAVGLMLASVFCAHFLHWAVFAAMFSETEAPRAFLAGAVLFVANGSLAALAGNALGGLLPHSMQNLGGVAGIMVLALVALVIAVFIAYRRVFGLSGVFALQPLVPVRADAALGDGGANVGSAPSAQRAEQLAGTTSSAGESADVADAGASLAEPEMADLMKDRMQRYVAEYGLTPRETEVALLTIQGFSCSYIAEKLVVSNSTVRYHQQNLYRKFDVHSRNELIELATMGAQGD